jgi:AcrR family transcriptional regulator
VSSSATSRRGQREAKPRQGDRRERAILDAARDLLGKSALADLTIEQIARAAGVSRSSLYFHFADKEQILAVLYGEVLEQMTAELDRWFADPDKHSEPWSHNSIEAAVTIATRNANVLRPALDNRGASAEIDRVLTTYFDRAAEQSALLIERERAAGLAPATGPAPDALARALMQMTLHSIHGLLRADASPRDTEELIETLTVIWARAVGTDPA